MAAPAKPCKNLRTTKASIPGATYRAPDATVNKTSANKTGFLLPSESLKGPATKKPIAAPSVTPDSEYCTNASGTSKKAAIFG